MILTYVRLFIGLSPPGHPVFISNSIHRHPMSVFACRKLFIFDELLRKKLHFDYNIVTIAWWKTVLNFTMLPKSFIIFVFLLNFYNFYNFIYVLTMTSWTEFLFICRYCVSVKFVTIKDSNGHFIFWADYTVFISSGMTVKHCDISWIWGYVTTQKFPLGKIFSIIFYCKRK